MENVMAGRLVTHTTTFAAAFPRLGSSSSQCKACTQKEILGTAIPWTSHPLQRLSSSAQKKNKTTTTKQGSSSTARTVTVMAGIGLEVKELFHALEQKFENSRETILEFYVHEIRGGPERTLLLAAGTGNGDLTKLGFGSICVFDNEVREAGSRESKLLGRERGYGHVTDKEAKEGLQLSSRITFNAHSEYGPGSLTFSGNVGGVVSPYELIVVGGTGRFRGAKGYVTVENSPPNPPDFVFHWKVHLTL
jgi:hypothetical protein